MRDAILILCGMPVLLAQQAAESPVPAPEARITGFVEGGYRWRTDVGGSFDSYRSIVNLGSGPKLLGLEFTLTDPKHWLFDEVHVRAHDWGGDPYGTFHLDARKDKLYQLRVDYRDMAYFSMLPSYADPLAARGIILSERSFDTRRRFGSFAVDLLPGNWLVPYLAFDRDSGSGNGATTFVSDGNEYPVPNRLRDMTNLYRGGVRIERRRFHATLEQGGTTFKDDQSVYQSPGPANFGNVLTPVSGHTLDLTSLLASYGIRGSGVYSKGLFTSNPAPWLDVYAQFLYSQPQTDVHYQQADAGSLYLQSQFLFFSSQQYLASAAAKLPHTTASFGAEIRPLRRFRILESWMTDRLHNGSAESTSQILTGAAGTRQIAGVLASSLASNYNQHDLLIFLDAGSKFVVRGGYRYIWGDASDVILPATGLASSDSGKLRRNVAQAAVTYRPAAKLSATAETEVGISQGVYFRTSLYNYQKVRGMARYTATNSLSFSADVTVLNNHNPSFGVNSESSSHQASLSVSWSPAGGKLGDFQGSYTRGTIYSDISYLSPQDLRPQRSLYRDNEHSASGLFNLKIPARFGVAPVVAAGGSFLISSGNRPTRYFQPAATVRMPLTKKVSWLGEWRYYGYGESFYLYEGFRTHLMTTGLRWTL